MDEEITLSLTLSRHELKEMLFGTDRRANEEAPHDFLESEFSGMFKDVGAPQIWNAIFRHENVIAPVTEAGIVVKEISSFFEDAQPWFIDEDLKISVFIGAKGNHIQNVEIDFISFVREYFFPESRKETAWWGSWEDDEAGEIERKKCLEAFRVAINKALDDAA